MFSFETHDVGRAFAGVALGATMMATNAMAAANPPILENPDLARPAHTQELSMKDAQIVEAKGCSASCAQAIGRLIRAINTQYKQDRANCEAKYLPGTPDIQNCYNWATGVMAMKYVGLGGLAVAGGVVKALADRGDGGDDDRNNHLKGGPKFG